MSLEILRNVVDGSMRDVETNSDEYVELINERYDHDGSARPKWEITGRHHTQRLDDDNAVGEADFGYAHKPVAAVVADLEDIKPEEHPERALTPGEVDSGVESWESKMESINASQASSATIGHTADRPVEPLEKTEPADRQAAGVAAAGRSGNGKGKNKTAAKSGSSGSSGSGSGSSSSSGSSSASSSGSSGS